MLCRSPEQKGLGLASIKLEGHHCHPSILLELFEVIGSSIIVVFWFPLELSVSVPIVLILLFILCHGCLSSDDGIASQILLVIGFISHSIRSIRCIIYILLCFCKGCELGIGSRRVFIIAFDKNRFG
jgi:hypothetical protein